ncbi:MAG TPA: M50 family metallopeptidase [Thermoleophilaceae bacterium]|nr:M50 family metallopeptidase [Thermoleophilaceae bacterium]
MSWFLAFAGFALLVILHELGHFAVAKWVGMRVEKFSLFFPPTIASKKVGETEYAIGLIPAGGYVKISGMSPAEDLPDEVRTRAYHAQPVWKRMAVIIAGPAVNLILAFVLLFVYFGLIGPETSTDRVGSIEKGYPAAAALEPGDRLIAVDGVRGDTIAMSKQIARHKCAQDPPTDGCRAATPATLVLGRDGRRVVEKVTPIYDAGTGVDRTRIGFTYAAGPRETLPAGEAFTTTADRFWFITKQTVSLPARIFDTEQRKEISGIVGSYEVTRQYVLNDLAQAVGILAIISLSLAIVNLFPFLPLDGGHIFWAAVEKLRGGKPVPFSVMERAGVVGFMLVIGLFAIGLSNDIGRLSGEGFQVP